MPAFNWHSKLRSTLAASSGSNTIASLLMKISMELSPEIKSRYSSFVACLVAVEGTSTSRQIPLTASCNRDRSKRSSVSTMENQISQGKLLTGGIATAIHDRDEDIS